MASSSIMEPNSSNLQELRDTVDRLAARPHVELVLVLNGKGDILMASSDNNQSSDDTSNTSKGRRRRLPEIARGGAAGFAGCRECG